MAARWRCSNMVYTICYSVYIMTDFYLAALLEKCGKGLHSDQITPLCVRVCALTPCNSIRKPKMATKNAPKLAFMCKLCCLIMPNGRNNNQSACHIPARNA